MLFSVQLNELTGNLTTGVCLDGSNRLALSGTNLELNNPVIRYTSMDRC